MFSYLLSLLYATIYIGFQTKMLSLQNAPCHSLSPIFSKIACLPTAALYLPLIFFFCLEKKIHEKFQILKFVEMWRLDKRVNIARYVCFPSIRKFTVYGMYFPMRYFVKATISDGRLTLRCVVGDKFETYPSAKISKERMDDLCSLICS